MQCFSTLQFGDKIRNCTRKEMMPKGYGWQKLSHNFCHPYPCPVLVLNSSVTNGWRQSCHKCDANAVLTLLPSLKGQWRLHCAIAVQLLAGIAQAKLLSGRANSPRPRSPIATVSTNVSNWFSHISCCRSLINSLHMSDVYVTLSSVKR